MVGYWLLGMVWGLPFPTALFLGPEMCKSDTNCRAGAASAGVRADPMRIAGYRAQALVHVNDTGAAQARICVDMPHPTFGWACIQLYPRPSRRLMSKASYSLANCEVDLLCCAPVNWRWPPIIESQPNEHCHAQLVVHIKAQAC